LNFTFFCNLVFSILTIQISGIEYERTTVHFCEHMKNPEIRDEKAVSKGEQTRAAIVESAYALFLAKGYHGTSMRQIAERAGLALGGIYNHFASKEEIFAAVFDTHHPYHRVLPIFEDAHGETVKAFVHDAARRIEKEVVGFETKILPLMFVELVEFQGQHMAQLVQTFLPKAIGFVQRFTERRGKLRSTPLPIMLRMLISMFVGYLMTGIVLRQVPGFNNLSVDWFDGMVDIYLHGILDESDRAPEA